MNETKLGKIYLVGFGPGSRDHMTSRAIQAIQESDVVIGYTTYIQLVKDLLLDKQVVRKGMTEEIDRCIEALEQAKKGHVVALISSGDIGIYGMAGPMYEVLLQSGWTPESEIAVEVVSGTTALSACAALVGAPLTHDFCSISLSDLLTPWPTIARRLESAAKGDFVIALYNPKSGRRTGQIVEAQKILLRYRSAKTPVAIVKSAYRRKQNIQHTSLDAMSECDIGMLSTVLIGNSSSFVAHQLMITPRGYANKYQNLTGEAHAGEQAGHSLSMGLQSWKACVATYVRQNPEESFSAIAEYFLSSEAEIFSALQICAAEENGQLNQKVVTLVSDATGIESTFDFFRQKGCFTLCMQNHGVEFQTLVNQGVLSIDKSSIRIKDSGIHMTIKRNSLKQIWLIESEYKQFIFTDKEGKQLFSVLVEL